MDANDQHALIVIMIVGTVIMAVGGTLLLLAFRAYGRAKKGDIAHVVLTVATIAFVFLACIGLFIWSLLRR